MRDTVISPQALQYHTGIRWPHHSCREMHQSRMFFIQLEYVFSQRWGKNLISPSSHAFRPFSASGRIFTNHWSERYGSMTVLQR